MDLFTLVPQGLKIHEDICNGPNTVLIVRLECCSCDRRIYIYIYIYMSYVPICASFTAPRTFSPYPWVEMERVVSHTHTHTHTHTRIHTQAPTLYVIKSVVMGMNSAV